MSSRSGSGRQAILIVGMHRSGTSAATRVLNLLGVPLPDKLVGAFAGNELGHWEPEELPALHDQMLRDAGANVNGVTPIDRGWFASDQAAQAAERVAAYLEETFPEAPLFALKDPRMALFIPVWRRALHQLGIAPRFLLPFRAPSEVAASLSRRQLAAFPDSVWPPARGELVWLNYVLSAERDTRDAPRAFLKFDALLQDWRGEAARIAAQLGLSWPRTPDEAAADIERYLSREHKHENLAEPAVIPLARRAYDQLRACVSDPYATAEAFDAAGRDLEASRAVFGEYVAALESLAGSLPTLNTEFGDFPSAYAEDLAPGHNASPEQLREALARSRALLLAAETERRVQTAALRQLQLLNAALTQAQMDITGSGSGADMAEVQQELERVRQEVAELRGAQGPLTVKVGAQRTLLEEQEQRLQDLQLAVQAAERRAHELFDENEQNKARLAYAERDMAGVLNSTSWRLTGPIRKIAARLARRTGG